MDFPIAVRTVLGKSPGLRSRDLVLRLQKKTGLSRSTIFYNLGHIVLRQVVYREKGKYYLPYQWDERVTGKRRYAHPRIRFEPTQKTSSLPQTVLQLPAVGFNMKSRNNYPVQVRTEVRMFLGGRDLGLVHDAKGYYDGHKEIRFEPGEGYEDGVFSILEECVKSDEELGLRVDVTLIDPRNIEHKISRSWTYLRDKNDWSYEP